MVKKKKFEMVEGEELMVSKRGLKRYVPWKRQGTYLDRGWKFAKAKDEVNNILDNPTRRIAPSINVSTCAICGFRSLEGGEVAAHLYKAHPIQMQKAVEEWMKANLRVETGFFVQAP
jgi:hypothetical protein